MDLWSQQQDDLVKLDAGAPTTIVSLDLPAGSYALDASVTVYSTNDYGDVFLCFFPGYAQEDAATTTRNQVANVTVHADATLAAPATIELDCVAELGGSVAIQGYIRALKVDTITHL